MPPLTLSFGSASFFDVSAGATTATRTLVGDAASLATGRMLLSRTVAVTLGAIVVAAAIPLMMLWFSPRSLLVVAALLRRYVVVATIENADAGTDITAAVAETASVELALPVAMLLVWFLFRSCAPILPW